MRRWLARILGFTGAFMIGLSPAIGYLSGNWLNACIAVGVGAGTVAMSDRSGVGK